jgi:peptidoglycan/LPS O-acetylase OafA/YrhL
MASAMQLYAGFALVVIAIVAIIALAAIVSNLIGVLRRRFGRTGASRSATPASRSEDPRASR